MKKYLILAIILLTISSCKEDEEKPVEYNYHTEKVTNSYYMYEANTGKKLGVKAYEHYTEPTSNKFGDKINKGYFEYQVEFDDFTEYFSVGCFPDGNSYDIYLYFDGEKIYFDRFSKTKEPDYSDKIYLQKDEMILAFKKDFGLCRFKGPGFDYRILD